MNVQSIPIRGGYSFRGNILIRQQRQFEMMKRMTDLLLVE